MKTKRVKTVRCKRCDGTGSARMPTPFGMSAFVFKCPQCHGTGRRRKAALKEKNS